MQPAACAVHGDSIDRCLFVRVALSPEFAEHAFSYVAGTQTVALPTRAASSVDASLCSHNVQRTFAACVVVLGGVCVSIARGRRGARLVSTVRFPRIEDFGDASRRLCVQTPPAFARPARSDGVASLSPKPETRIRGAKVCSIRSLTSPAKKAKRFLAFAASRRRFASVVASAAFFDRAVVIGACDG